MSRATRCQASSLSSNAPQASAGPLFHHTADSVSARLAPGSA